ncbi:MAG: hypothetical protein B6I36_00220, partial [Desulfobacteraceae bacterium 4572_35.1]
MKKQKISQITCSCASELPQDVACQIVITDEKHWPELAGELSPRSDAGMLQQVSDDGEFNAKAGETLLLHGGGEIPRLLLIGLSAQTAAAAEQYRAAAALAVQQLRQRKLTSWVFDLSAIVNVGDGDVATV